MQQRHARAAAAWAAYLQEIRAWKIRCIARTCPDCDGLCAGKVCHLCYAPATDALLAQLLRQLAGINGGHAKPPLTRDVGNGGVPGFRSCGPGQWDNSVRAAEEDM